MRFSAPRERDFINKSLTSKIDPNLTGTKVTYVKPEGEDDLSMYSKDDEDEFEGAGPIASKHLNKNPTTGIRTSRTNFFKAARLDKFPCGELALLA